MARKLEETFNLPSLNELNENEEQLQEYTMDEINDIMERADKIDAALPQVSGLDRVDADYDLYAKKAIETFDDLIELGKNVEDRHAAEIFNAASNMMSNALAAKTNKANKKIEMVKLQIRKAQLEHEKEKLEYLKQKHLANGSNDRIEETAGKVITTRNEMLNEILSKIKNEEDS